MLPLILEEPRRSIVALEMFFNKNFFIPTVGNIIFLDHPPGWAWALNLGFQIFGFTPLTGRILCILFHLLTGLLLFLVSKNFTSKKIALTASLLYLASADIYFYYSFLGEMDTFYSFLSLSTILLVFLAYEKNKSYLIFIACLITLLGYLTKGLTSLIFFELTFLGYSLYKKNLKILFSFSHLLGIIALLTGLGF